MSKPYIETKLDDNIYIRHFSSGLNSDELVWHRDRESRIIESITQTDWLVQLDNELPTPIIGEIFIEKGVFHRLIGGSSDLKIKIKKIF